MSASPNFEAGLEAAKASLVPCANCKSESVTADHPVLRKVCGVCGFPRTYVRARPLLASLPSTAELAALSAAKRDVVVGDGARFAAFALFASAFLAGGLGALVVLSAALPGVLLLGIAAVLVAAGTVLLRRSAKSSLEASAKANEALEEAVRGHVDAARGAVSDSDVEALFGVDEAAAKRLLTIATALGSAQIDVDASGHVRALPQEFPQLRAPDSGYASDEAEPFPLNTNDSEKKATAP